MKFSHIMVLAEFLSPFTSQLFAAVLVKNLTFYLVVALDLTNPLSHLRKLLNTNRPFYGLVKCIRGGIGEDFFPLSYLA